MALVNRDEVATEPGHGTKVIDEEARHDRSRNLCSRSRAASWRLTSGCGLASSRRPSAAQPMSCCPTTRFAGLETVAQFAARAGVSAPSILRFIARLGFTAYADFQRRLKEELEAQLQSPLMKQTPSMRNGSRASRLRRGGARQRRPDLRGARAGRVRRDLVPPRRHQAADPFRRRPLHRGDRALCGASSADHPTRRGLDRGTGCHMARPGDRFGQRDVLVIFDIRAIRRTWCAGRGGGRPRRTIVLFTDQWLSPIARLAKHVISARIVVPSNWDSSAAIFAVVEALMAEATKTLWEVAEPRMKALEDLRHKRR